MPIKNPIARFALVGAGLALCLLASPVAHAATYYWDNNGATAGFGTAAGTWASPTTGNATQGWSTNSAGTVVPGSVTTTTTDDLNFGTATDALATGSISVAAAGTKNAGNITVGAVSGTVTLAGGTITYGASPVFTINGNVTLAHGSPVAGAATSLTKTGSGILSLSANNSYGGAVNINGGAITVNSLTNFNVASGLGLKASNLSSNLVIDGGTLRVQVSAGTSDRLFTVGAGGATLEAMLTGVNSGQILLTGATAVAYTGVGNRTLTIGGTSDDAGGSSIARVIGDVGGGNGTVALAKTGVQDWTVSGTNTYTGGTTVSGAGTLTMGSLSALGSTSGQLTVNAGTLNMAANNLTVGNLTGTGGTISGTSGARTLTIGQGNGTGGNFQGVIANGSGGTTALTKTGNGTITLSGANTYTGATAVNAGTLLANNSSGSATGTGSVIVNGGTFGGTGAVSGAVTVNSGAFLAPGASIASLASGTVTLNNLSTFTYEVDSSVALATGADLQIVNGNLSIANGGSDVVTLTLSDLAGVPTAFADGTTFSLFNYNGTWNSGLFNVGASEIANGDTFTAGLNTWQLNYDETVAGSNFSGEHVYLNFVNIVAVPEPATLALLGAGVAIAGLTVLRRRRRPAA